MDMDIGLLKEGSKLIQENGRKVKFMHLGSILNKIIQTIKENFKTLLNMVKDFNNL